MPTLNEFRYTTYSDPVQGRISRGNLITLSGADSNQYGKTSNSGITVSTTVPSLVVPVGDKINVPIILGGTTNEGEYVLQIGVFQGNRFIEFYNSGPSSYYGSAPLNVTLTIPELPTDINYSIYYQVQPTSGKFYKKSALLTQGESSTVKITTSGNIPVGANLPIISSGSIVKRKNFQNGTISYSVSSLATVGTSGIFTNEGYTDYFPFFEIYSPNNTNGDIILKVKLESNLNLGNIGLLSEAPKLVVVRSPSEHPNPFKNATIGVNDNYPEWTFEGALAKPSQSTVIEPSSSDIYGFLEYRIPPPQKGNFLCIMSSGVPYAGVNSYVDAPAEMRNTMRLETVSSASFYVKSTNIGPKSTPLAYKAITFDISSLSLSSQSSGYVLNCTLQHSTGVLEIKDRQIPRTDSVTLVVNPNLNFSQVNVEITDGKYYSAVYTNPIPATSDTPLVTTLVPIRQQTSGGEGIYLLSTQDIYQSQSVLYWQSPVVRVLVRPLVGVVLTVAGLPTGTSLEMVKVASPYGPNTVIYEGYIKNASSNTVRAGTYKVDITLLKEFVQIDSTVVNLFVEPPPI